MEAWFPAASPVRRFDVSEEGLKKRLAQSKVVAHAGNGGLARIHRWTRMDGVRTAEGGRADRGMYGLKLV